LQQSARCYTLGERDERKPHDAHSVGFFDFLARRHIFHACLGCLLALCLQFLSLVVYDSSHTGKERFSWPVGAGDLVYLLFELWFGNNYRRRRASEKESLIVGYTKILGTGSCFCSIRYFVSLVNFFFLYRFSLAMLVLLIMLVSSLGQRKNTSSSYFYH
jgi:hypothetical protein